LTLKSIPTAGLLNVSQQTSSIVSSGGEWNGENEYFLLFIHLPTLILTAHGQRWVQSNELIEPVLKQAILVNAATHPQNETTCPNASILSGNFSVESLGNVQSSSKLNILLEKTMLKITFRESEEY